MPVEAPVLEMPARVVGFPSQDVLTPPVDVIDEPRPTVAKTIGEVSFRDLLRGLRIAILIIIGAMIGAAIVSFIVLGKPLFWMGVAVAFAMTMFIGLPLMLASIQDAMEAEH